MTIFERDEFKPYARRWYARQQAFSRRRAYYDGSVYNGVLGALDWLGPRFAGRIQPLYLPCARAVNVDSGIVPGGWALAPGAEHLAAALATLFEWSDWSTEGVLYVHYGALYGNSVLRVSDLRAAGRVVVAPVAPESCLLVESGAYDRTPRLAIVVQALERGGTLAEYAEVIEPHRVRTFIDGEPQGLDGRPAAYANALGWVPFVEVRHINAGVEIGACAFQDALSLLDSVNDVAADLATIIKKHARPKWAVLGADEAELSNDDDIWTFPAGSDVKVLVPGIDVAGVLRFLQDMREQVEKAMPELAFDQVLAKMNIATRTIELQLMELILLIQRVRPNYDRGLERAARMAGRAARSMGLADVAALDDPALRFDPARPVLPGGSSQ